MEALRARVSARWKSLVATALCDWERNVRASVIIRLSFADSRARSFCVMRARTCSCSRVTCWRWAACSAGPPSGSRTGTSTGGAGSGAGSGSNGTSGRVGRMRGLARGGSTGPGSVWLASGSGSGGRGSGIASAPVDSGFAAASGAWTDGRKTIRAAICRFEQPAARSAVRQTAASIARFIPEGIVALARSNCGVS